VSGGSVSPWLGTFASAIWGAWGKRVPLPARNLWPQCGCAAKPCPQDAFHVCLPQSLLRGVNDLSEHRAQRADHCTATTSRVADGLASLSARVERVFLNETASRWENHSHSASLRPTSFALASRQQPPAQTAPLARATKLHIKANRVPFPAASFKSLYPKGRNGLR